MDSRTVLLLVATQVCLLAVVRCQEDDRKCSFYFSQTAEVVIKCIFFYNRFIFKCSTGAFNGVVLVLLLVAWFGFSLAPFTHKSLWLFGYSVAGKVCWLMIFVDFLSYKCADFIVAAGAIQLKKSWVVDVRKRDVMDGEMWHVYAK